MNRVQIISDKNQRSLKIKSTIQKEIIQNEIKRYYNIKNIDITKEKKNKNVNKINKSIY